MELKTIKDELELFQFGCRYIPASPEIGALFDAVRSLEKKLSRKEWGR